MLKYYVMAFGAEIARFNSLADACDWAKNQSDKLQSGWFNVHDNEDKRLLFAAFDKGERVI